MATADVLITRFENLVNDKLDPTTEYQLLNDAKDEIEGERDYKILITLDQSQSVVSGDTYLTMKTLPADFGRPLDSGIYVGTDIIPYTQMLFEDRYQVTDSISHRYYVDLVNAQYGIMGKPNAGTIFFFYVKATADLASGQTWVFPARFHKLLPYKMAMLYFAIDQGEKARAWDDRWKAYYDMMHDQLVYWDAKNSMGAIQNRAGSVIDTRFQPLIISGMQ